MLLSLKVNITPLPMKKKVFYLLMSCVFLFLFAGTVWAEGYKKPVILVANFNHDDTMTEEEAAQMRTATLSRLRDGRVIIKDAATASEISAEIRRQIMKAQTAEEIVSLSEVCNLSVDYILTGGFNTLVVAQKEKEVVTYPKKGVKEVSIKYYWEASLNYSYKLLSIKDGSVVTSYASSTTSKDDDSGDKARAGVFKRGCIFLFSFYDAIAPLQADLVESDYVVEKDKLKSCYVMLGSEHGVCAGTELEVFKVRYIAGQEVLENVGYMEITEVVAPSLSKCKMRKRASGKEILSAIKENLKLQTTNPDARPLQVKVIGSVPSFWDKLP